MQQWMINFQQDTFQWDKVLADNKTSGLLVDRGQASFNADLERDSIALKPTAEKPVVKNQPNRIISSVGQTRNRWWQKEKELTVGNLRYMNMQRETGLTATMQHNDKALALPQRELKTENRDWLTVLLLLALVLFASVRSAYSKYLNSLFQSLFNYSTSARMFQEKNHSFLHAAFRLEVYFYITFSVFLFQVLRFFEITTPYQNFRLYIYSFGLVLVYFIGKKMVYKLIGGVIEGRDETSEYLFNMDNINRVTGLVLFPVVALIAFYPFENTALPVFSGLILAGLFYFLLLFRGFTILLKKQFSIFYLFLYFCTLEILPLVLLYKIVAL